GSDLVIGDNGQIINVVINGVAVVQTVETLTPALGGDDAIETDDNDAKDGADTAFGGFGNDVINTYGLGDLVAGDNARIDYFTTLALPRQVQSFVTTSPGVGGDDTISTGDGDDVAFGGARNDQITLGSGDDVAAGDEAAASYASFNGSTSVLISVQTT